MMEPERLRDLAATFPTLAGYVKHISLSEVVPEMRVQAMTASGGTGKRQAALFCMWVWDHNVHHFDLAKAWPIWDSEHRAAYSAWAAAPFWL
jgi:hypothetical protein